MTQTDKMVYNRHDLSRRRSTIRTVRATAMEVAKNIELEIRVARVEAILQDMREALDLLSKRAAAVQAQLDHVNARVGRR